MKILFVKGHTLFSKAICWVVDEPVSHVAIQIGSFVCHSNLLGVHIQSAYKFRQGCDVIYELQAPKGSKVFLIDSLNRYDGAWYDFGAFAFLGICLYLNSRFGVPTPTKNPWQDKNAFICTEWVTQVLDHKADSMITPYKLYFELKEKWSK